MLEKLKNILIKFFENPLDDAIFSFILGLIFLLLGTALGNILIKSVLYIASIGSSAVFLAASYVECHNIQSQKKNVKTKFKKSDNQEKSNETNGLRGNNIVKINYCNEVKHTSLEEYINKINFVEYLIITIGYPGFEQDLQSLELFKSNVTTDISQEQLDELDLRLDELKNEVCDRIEDYCEYINREPKNPRRRYKSGK